MGEKGGRVGTWMWIRSCDVRGSENNVALTEEGDTTAIYSVLYDGLVNRAFLGDGKKGKERVRMALTLKSGGA